MFYRPSASRALTKIGDARPRGVLYARANDGYELPVVDVTHPAFARLYDDAQMVAQMDRFVKTERARALIPSPLQRAMLRLAARRSRLAQGLSHASHGVVSGMTLYAAKLGPNMLGRGYPSFIDRQIAAAPPSWLARVRLEDMARLLADGLAPVLASAPDRALHLFNIAGGPAADSWNALLVLRQDGHADLRARKIAIQVLDLDEEGPAFGARAVTALLRSDAPLHGVDVTFRRVAYDWKDTARLRALLDEIGTAGGAVAVSSEGGLFEYGTDEDIVANLDAIRTGAPDDCIVVGSVTRAEGPIEFLREFTVTPRTLRAFRALAERGGFSVTRVIERPLSYDVLLARAP